MTKMWENKSHQAGSMFEQCHRTGVLTHLPLNKMAAILTDDILKWIFWNENDKTPIKISLKFIP